jgi:glutamate synthase domain-containing protein 2
MAALFDSRWLFLAGAAGALSLVGVRDYFQTRHAILRNYPLLAHFRFFFEAIRPEIRQYLLEGDNEAVPFSRAQRSLVYQRAKNVESRQPFGTGEDVYLAGYEWINHSLRRVQINDFDFRVKIGGKACKQPYSCSVFNISAMSFGALSANAVRALNKGQARQFCPRYRRGLDQPLSPRVRWRSNLGDWQRLFRLPDAERKLRPAESSRCKRASRRSR